MKTPLNYLIHFCIPLLLPISLIAAIRLDSYNIDPKWITVSGISSGAAMATQYHVAFSSEIHGAGLIAGIPYACAEQGGIPCIDSPEKIDIQKILLFINEQAAIGKIDAPSNIKDDNIFIFHGTIDHRVLPGNGLLLKDLYDKLDAIIKTELTMEAAHGYPTSLYGGPCAVYSPETQFINNCSYHAAFETLNHLYNGTLVFPTGSEVLNNLIAFDQLEFGGGTPSGMDDLGFAYVPIKCEDRNVVCKLHVAFHGCQQYKGAVGDIVVKNMGYLEVAEANGIVIVFPQNAKSEVNPNGCWDWWGYLDDEYLTKLGGQMQTVNKMVKRISVAKNFAVADGFGWAGVVAILSFSYLMTGDLFP